MASHRKLFMLTVRTIHCHGEYRGVF